MTFLWLSIKTVLESDYTRAAFSCAGAWQAMRSFLSRRQLNAAHFRTVD